MKNVIVIVLIVLLTLNASVLFGQKTKVIVSETQWNVSTNLVGPQEKIGVDAWNQILNFDVKKYESMYGQKYRERYGSKAEAYVWAYLPVVLRPTNNEGENVCYGGTRNFNRGLRNGVFEIDEYRGSYSKVASNKYYNLELWSYLKAQPSLAGYLQNEDNICIESVKLAETRVKVTGKKMFIKLYIDYNNGQWSMRHEILENY